MTRTIDASNSAAEVAMGYELADSTPSSTACCNRYDAWALDYNNTPLQGIPAVPPTS